MLKKTARRSCDWST